MVFEGGFRVLGRALETVGGFKALGGLQSLRVVSEP